MPRHRSEAAGPVLELELTPLHEASAPDPRPAIADALYVERMLAAVDPGQRAVVVLHYYLDLTLPETAAALGIPVGTAESRLNRALAAMRIRSPSRTRHRSPPCPRSDSHEPIDHERARIFQGPAACGSWRCRRVGMPDYSRTSSRKPVDPTAPGMGTRRRLACRGACLPRQGVPRVAVLLALVSLLVASLVGGLVYVGSQSPEPRLGLPATPEAWERVVIDPDGEGAILAVAAGPRGLLAAVGEGAESRLYASTDGRDWTRVAADQHGPGRYSGAALVATDDGFLLVGNEVRASDDGVTWRRVASSADDPDLGVGTPIAAAVGGPGLVAVGSDNKAWYSTDGTDWSLADVPPPLDKPSRLTRPLDPDLAQGTTEMLGVAVFGRDLIAWGTSNWVHDDGSSTFMPVLWASRRWNVVDRCAGSASHPLRNGRRWARRLHHRGRL